MFKMAEAPLSAISATTDGGCTFDELCRGIHPNYACDNTVDIRKTNFEKAKEKILIHIANCIHSLETQSDRIVTQFYIGKTYIHQRKKPGGGYISIDPQRNSTYRKGGISSRWHEHRRNHYGRDGMVVLTIVTRNTVPAAARSTCKLHQEDYAFALEQTLLHHFMISFPDNRIANEGFATGGTDNRTSAAYAIYMAFRTEELELPDPEDDEDSTGSQCTTDEEHSESRTPTKSIQRDGYRAYPVEPCTEHRKTVIRFSEPLVTGCRESQGESTQESVTEVVPPGGGHIGTSRAAVFPSHSDHANKLTRTSRVSVQSRDGAACCSTNTTLDQPFTFVHDDRSHFPNCISSQVFSSPSSGREREEEEMALATAMSISTERRQDRRRAREMRQEEEQLQEAKRRSLEDTKNHPHR